MKTEQRDLTMSALKAEPPKPGRGQEQVPPTAPRVSTRRVTRPTPQFQPNNITFGFLASRTMTESISTILSHQVLNLSW